MPAITIPRNEQGRLRVFSLSMSDDAARALRDNADPFPQIRALGVAGVDARNVEVFPVADLAEIGLLGYLRDGNDVDENALARDAAKLAGIAGWVMLVHSPAFGGAEMTLNPAPELTLIGTYDRQQADRPDPVLESNAAAPYSGTARLTPATPPKGRAGSTLVVVGLAVIAGLLLLWALR